MMAFEIFQFTCLYLSFLTHFQGLVLRIQNLLKNKVFIFVQTCIGGLLRCLHNTLKV